MDIRCRKTSCIYNDRYTCKAKILIFQKVVFAESFKKGDDAVVDKTKTCFQELQVMHLKEIAKQLRLNVPRIAFLTMMVIARRMGLRLMI